jgi:hypothetical protein
MSRDHEQIFTPPAPAPELGRTLADTLTDATRSVVQYELDRLNPFSEIQSQLRMIEQAGRGIAGLYNTAKDLLTPQDNMERLERAAGLDTPGTADALERFHEAAGLELVRDGQDALEQLNNAAGVALPDPTRTPGATLDQTPGGVSPELGQAIAPEVEEQVLELGIEFLL